MPLLSLLFKSSAVLVFLLFVYGRIYCGTSLPEGDFSRISLSGNDRVRFMTNDDPRYRDPSFPDAKWIRVTLPHFWPETAKERSRTAWYRIHVRLPEKLPDRVLGIRLGKIESLDETYWNGTLIGVNGMLVKDVKDASDRIRIYEIPARLVRPGADNVVAVRVTSQFDNGGIEVGPFFIDIYDTILRDFYAFQILECSFVVAYFLFFCYFLLFFIRRRNEQEFLIFSLLNFLAGTFYFTVSQLSYLFVRDNMILQKANYISLLLIFPVFLWFLVRFFKEKTYLLYRIFYAASVVGAGIVLMTNDSVLWENLVMVFAQPFWIIAACACILILIRNYRTNSDARSLMATGILLCASFLFDIVQTRLDLVILPEDHYITLFTFVIFIVNLVLLINDRYVRLNKEIELSKAKTRLFANISHEFRTPLTLILGPIDSIIAGDYGGSLRNDDGVFRTIQNNSLKLMKMINQLLDLSKIDAGKMQLNRTWVDVSKRLEIYAGIVKPLAVSRGISLLFRDNTGGVSAMIDEDLFETAVFNLLSNAVKFTPRGGAVILQLDRKLYVKDLIEKEGMEKQFYVSVIDNGPGIPANLQNDVFERFHQGASPGPGKNEGTGIGLALAKEIVELHGGRIFLKSMVGKGSSFILSFPDIKEGASASELSGISREMPDVKRHLLSGIVVSGNEPALKPEKPAASESVLTVLVIDDNAEMLEFIRSLLAADYRVLTADDGAKGLQAAISDRPDLILLDMMMPEMDGMEFTEKIKSDKDLKDIPIIMVTARADISPKIAMFERGADDYIVKPFNAVELKARLRNQSNRMQMIRELKARLETILRKDNELKESGERNREIRHEYEESARRFEETADILPVAVLELDRELAVDYVNRSGKELLGILPEQGGTKLSMTAFLKPEDVKRFRFEIERSLHGDTGLAGFQLVNSRKENVTVLVKIAPRRADGQWTGSRLVLLEIKSFLTTVLKPDALFLKRHDIRSREADVLMLVFEGCSNKEIGKKLFISENTVKTHLKNIYQKIGVSGREGLFSILKSEISQKYGTDSFIFSILKSIISSD